MAHCATRGVPDDHQAALKHSEADDPRLSVVLPLVFDLGSQSIEDQRGVLKVEPAVDQSPIALGGIVGYAHAIIVYTIMPRGMRDGNESGF
jgi:hypothetical protein